MKIKVNKTTTETVEVDLKTPSYWKKGDSNFAKIIDEKKCIHVWRSVTMPEHDCINYTNNVGSYIEKGAEITEEEFNAAYDAVLTRFNELKQIQ